MNVVITGGAGFLGQRLAKALLETGIAGPSGQPVPIKRLMLADHASIPQLDDARVSYATGDIADPAFVAAIVADDCHLLFHLAAVVSSQAEADFDLGMRVNVDASRLVLERCRAIGSKPRVIFTSSVAVFGPAEAGAEPVVSPRSSYGAGKAISELMLSDYARRGYVEGVVLRLPTITVRPGKPNQAASSFVSGIVREPLSGEDAVCPVATETRLWLLSPRGAIAGMLHAAGLPAEALAASPVINLPGISVTVADIIASVARVGGAPAAARIRMVGDERIDAIVSSWPGQLDDRIARKLGFPGDESFDEIVRQFVENDLPVALGA